ncbi:hypothetical protein K0C01_11870 [Salinarchaeum sp. IM2453]|uniref:hypothetical protein n=1 Tax=Salinarchaeum sp. IM2453 TaxID=2862870 RepID=UPI001C83151C|nr:hypothetical protein [Salinarchaeum sp. IM2453]QZA88462.1 hypothetical protein K0C01_11870 [Salinarchaeum sp. IM2453]
MDKTTQIGQFTHWINQRPNTIEFWEISVTPKHLIWCFAGESYRSMLLRADTAKQRRSRIKEATPTELIDLHEKNFQIPVTAIKKISYAKGTRLRRGTLDITCHQNEKRSEFSLVSTSKNVSHHSTLEKLRHHPQFKHVEITTNSKGILNR